MVEKRQFILTYLGRAVLPLICLLLVGWFVGHAIIGPTGLIAGKQYTAERQALERQVAANRETKAALSQRVKLLSPGGVDLDLADELAHRDLNVVKPDEVIVKLDAK